MSENTSDSSQLDPRDKRNKYRMTNDSCLALPPIICLGFMLLVFFLLNEVDVSNSEKVALFAACMSFGAVSSICGCCYGMSYNAEINEVECMSVR
jgi:hypothetical protein